MSPFWCCFSSDVSVSLWIDFFPCLKVQIFPDNEKVLLMGGFQVSFPGSSVVKDPPARTGDAGHAVSIPGLGRSCGEGNDNPSLLAWIIPWTVQGVAKSLT